MTNHFEKRVDPVKLVPGAKTVISVLLNYYPSQYPLHSDVPKVSKYAYGKDYHYTVRGKLKQLFDFIKENIKNLDELVNIESLKFKKLLIKRVKEAEIKIYGTKK